MRAASDRVYRVIGQVFCGFSTTAELSGPAGASSVPAPPRSRTRHARARMQQGRRAQAHSGRAGALRSASRAQQGRVRRVAAPGSLVAEARLPGRAQGVGREAARSRARAAAARRRAGIAGALRRSERAARHACCAGPGPRYRAPGMWYRVCRQVAGHEARPISPCRQSRTSGWPPRGLRRGASPRLPRSFAADSSSARPRICRVAACRGACSGRQMRVLGTLQEPGAVPRANC